jgi:hypothetical protein
LLRTTLLICAISAVCATPGWAGEEPENSGEAAWEPSLKVPAAPTPGPARVEAAAAAAPAPEVPWTTYAAASASAAFGAGAGFLLSMPAAIPVLYLGALVGIPPLFSSVLVLMAVPMGVGLGSGFAAAAFAPGWGPVVTGLVAGSVATGLTLVVGALVAPRTPNSLFELNLGVLSLVAVPSLASAAAAAATAPWFVAGPAAEIE